MELSQELVENCVNGGSLNASANCTIEVEYTPSGSGVDNDTIVIDYNNGVSATTSHRQVTGNGQTPASLSIDGGPTYNFGSTGVGVPVTHIFNVTNSGDVNATGLSEVGLAPPYTFNGGSYPGTGGNCGDPIPNGVCTIDIEFNPAGSGTFPPIR